MVLAALCAKAVVVPADSKSFYTTFPYICILNPGDSLALTDELFLDRAAQVTFAVGQSRLPLGLPLLGELSTQVAPHINADSLQLVKLIVCGSASPDGAAAKNEQLGQQRTQAMVDFMMSHIALPSADMLSATTTAEDYGTLCLLMRRAADPDYALVQQLCDSLLAPVATTKGMEQLKRRLRTEQGGRMWARLLTTYFPQLRAARFLLVLRKMPPPTSPDTVAPALTVAPAAVATAQYYSVQSKSEQPALGLTPPAGARRELLSLKTNLLMDVAYVPGYNRWCPMPNVAIEYYPLHGHFTYGASFDMPWWQDYDAHKFFQVRNYQVETRYYLRSGSIDCRQPGHGAAFSGFYLQAYVHAGLFGICFDADHGWVGEGGGGGVGAGWVLPLSRSGHWRLELGAQVGYFRCKYDPYQFENLVNPNYRDGLYYYRWTMAPELFKRRQYRYSWLGPTRVGVTLTYDVIYRKKQPHTP